ncbi:outer membrane beta-barrel protein [Marinobacter sp. SS21]|uniref:outer membrane beta-barrel protein n=1 Tax=Marinobacter sp. SS21 TaxID=2979460 RepID=UPI00232C34CC|nr:outer membrane beta-barrel protein [Marinobacter sp. SS21]MDC0663523.1 outer membrane beta-barrel protein [Marinobacter sp. SS21]
MNKLLSALALPLAPALLLPAPLVLADEQVLREELHYVGLLATALNHRSIGETTKGAAWSNAGTLVVGGHLSELFHAELRAGGGLSEGTVDGELELDIDYFASWYIGLHYPVTSYANVYGQFGFSHISGDAELTAKGLARQADPDDASPYADLESKYPDSEFSVSWIIGADVQVFDNAYLVLEGGRLFKDTGTGANTFQFSSGVRYEF